MTDQLLQTLAIGVVAVLFAFELVVAFASWLEAGSIEPSFHRAPLVMTRPFAIREHFRTREHQTTMLRTQYPILRSPGYGHHFRAAIRRLQPSDPSASQVGCSSCRGSRMRGLPRCRRCGQRLIAPAHGSVA